MTDPSTHAHLAWLGYVQPVGLVVSPPALVAAQCTPPLDLVARQSTLHALCPDDRLGDLPAFTQALLDWQPADLVPAENLVELEVALPEYNDVLRPTWAVPKPDGEPGYQLLVVRAPGETDLDQAPEDATPGRAGTGWRASPQARIERLLRERDVPVGLLCNECAVRLVYAPRGETSGHLTFKLAELRTVAGRPMLGALCMLLGAERLFVVPPHKRLPRVLEESRKYQNEVSTRLAEQVLAALDELVRGFELADADRQGELLRHALADDPQHVYGGLITVLLRLVFLLYAEERDLMPADPVYVRHYSVGGLFEKLRADAGRHPDTMDRRFGAWARLISLFRLVHDGGGDQAFRLPARRGSLFDPEAWPFLEGRPYRTITGAAPIRVPRVPDGVVWKVLDALLMLKSGESAERVAFRSLDVEQIGSVYEAMMGFELRRASAPSLALRPKRVVVSLTGLLLARPAERARLLKGEADCALTGAAAQALKDAGSVEQLAAALSKKAVDGRIVAEGGLYLQPGEERRRSGSHYTPRGLTEPIVRATLRPVLAALGPRPRPEQILALKVCDPAMGSGAFLVEACRQLALALVEAWSLHGLTPAIPADEDAERHARRLVAQRCLYGVDKNPFAVNLARLSLWLVTLAKDHAFTFLDHALKHGDSLVGLGRRQIGRFDWGDDEAALPPFYALVERQAAAARVHRAAVQAAADGEEAAQRLAWRDSEDALEPARAAGDLCVAAFFAQDQPKAREARRRECQALFARWRDGDPRAGIEVASLRDRQRHDGVVPFHWEVEFPEVFDAGGFDALVGNPPFAGKNTLAASNHAQFPAWLKQVHAGSHGNADLVAHFFRRAWGLLRAGGAFGLIATNTIAQGDTRGSGLRWIRHRGGCIYDATRRLKWPGMAAVVVSVVHVAKGREVRPARLDGREVERITAFLFPRGPDDDPEVLAENAGKSFQGSIVLGMGFTFDDVGDEATPLAEMRRLIAKDPRNAERIFPYLGGQEVNDSPTHAHRRYVIHFGELSEAEARGWPDLMEIVERRVRGTRGSHSTAPWWQFERLRPEMYRAIAGLERVLVISRIGNAFAFTFLPAGIVPNEKIVVFPFTTGAALCALQSRAHEVWARFFGSTLKDDLQYTPSLVTETFPFPPAWDSSPALEAAGRAYHDFRAALMVRNDQGLTATYNRFHDPDERDPEIHELRRLHAAMDRAVLDAYGWSDIPTDCAFRLDYEEPEDEDDGAPRAHHRKKPWRLRWPESVHDEVLARLLALNQQRAGAERKMAAPEKRPGSRERALPGSQQGRTISGGNPLLFAPRKRLGD